MSGIFEAVADQKLRVLSSLLDSGVNPNVLDAERKTPLHYAVETGNVDLVNCLLAADAMPNMACNASEAPLFRAVAKGDHKMAQALIDAGADVNIYDYRNYRSLLMVAIKHDDTDMVARLLQAGASPNQGDHALSSALISDNHPVFAMLLEAGCSPLLLHRDDILHRAAQKQTVLFLQSLLACHMDINCRDKEQRTPLHAAAGGRGTNIEYLCSNGAEVDARDENSWTPLHHAASNGLLETVDILVNHGADVEARNHKGQMPLHLAASAGHHAVVTRLLDADADPGTHLVSADHHYNTPLMLAITDLAKDHSVHTQDASATAAAALLPFADQGTLVRLFEWLYRADGRPRFSSNNKGRRNAVALVINSCPGWKDCRDTEGNTLLHILCSRGAQTEDIKLLLDAGADANATNTANDTPLLALLGRKKPAPTKSAMQALLDAGADASRIGSSGLTAVQLINGRCEDCPSAESMAEILIDHGAEPAPQHGALDTPDVHAAATAIALR